jgi:hypothetical protein
VPNQGRAVRGVGDVVLREAGVLRHSVGMNVVWCAAGNRLYIERICLQPIADRRHRSTCDAASAPSREHSMGNADFAGPTSSNCRSASTFPDERVGMRMPKWRRGPSVFHSRRLEAIRYGRPPDLVVVLTGEVLRSVLSAETPQNDDAVKGGAPDRPVC